MNRDTYNKAIFEMDTVIRTLEDFDKLSAEQVKSAVNDAAHAMDTFISSIMGQTTVAKEFLVIREHIRAKRLIDEFCSHYFVLKGMGHKEFRKTSRDDVMVFGWKNTDATNKAELLRMLSDIKRIMARIWKSQR